MQSGEPAPLWPGALLRSLCFAAAMVAAPVSGTGRDAISEAAATGCDPSAKVATSLATPSSDGAAATGSEPCGPAQAGGGIMVATVDQGPDRIGRTASGQFASADGKLTATPTYQSMGLYLNAAPAPVDSGGARVTFRPEGSARWRNGFDLWYDPRNAEYRGSLVQLRPGTRYEIAVSLDDGTTYTLAARTWPDTKPVAKIVPLPALSTSTLTITEGGSPSGYIVYEPADGESAVIDVEKNSDFNIVVRASYVIVRGLTLKGARDSAILLGSTTEANAERVTDVVIEDNDISDWGSLAKPGCPYGKNLQSAVFSRASNLARITIQRNRLHNPTHGANNWLETNCSGESKHPEGPQAITLANSLGNHVIRNNEIYSREGHYFNDGMGETNNFSDRGFPTADTDIYGNFIRHCWDDGIESEGGNANVRIWGNYIDETYVKIAIAPVRFGPIYIFRNVGNVGKISPDQGRAAFFKLRNGGSEFVGGGQINIFNNTSLLPNKNFAVRSFLTEFDYEHRILNVNVVNNLAQVIPGRAAIKESYAERSVFSNNFTNSTFQFRKSRDAPGGTRKKFVFNSRPIIDLSSLMGDFALAPGSPGHDQGKVIPNFADRYTGSAPDVGAHEFGTGPMEFGVNADLSSSGGGD